MTHPSIAERLEKDIIAAMKARDGDRTTALRMVKTALKNKEIEKRAPLDEAESLQILATLIKQRRDSVEQFTKGNRPELAAKETAEIALIENYMPKAASEEELRKLVEATLAELACSGTRPRPEGHGTRNEGRAGPHSGCRSPRRRPPGKRNRQSRAGAVRSPRQAKRGPAHAQSRPRSRHQP